jgi:hypothetical protein
MKSGFFSILEARVAFPGDNKALSASICLDFEGREKP